MFVPNDIDTDALYRFCVFVTLVRFVKDRKYGDQLISVHQFDLTMQS